MSGIKSAAMGAVLALASSPALAQQRSVYIQNYGSDGYYDSRPRTVGQFFERMLEQIQPVLPLLLYTAMIVGIILFITGLVKLKHHFQQPTAIPLGVPVVRLIIGIALIALPFVMNVSIDTMFGTGTAEQVQPYGTQQQNSGTQVIVVPSNGQ
jgi:hypothetical protein